MLPWLFDGQGSVVVLLMSMFICAHVSYFLQCIIKFSSEKRKTNVMKRRILPLIFLLFLVGAVFSACDSGGSSSNAQSVNVEESEYHIGSDITTFTAGKTYHFVVKNTGKIAHEFMLMPRATVNNAIGDTSMNHEQMGSLVSISGINPGETKTVDYTFPASAKGTHPQFACLYEGHYEAGMWLDLAVK